MNLLGRVGYLLTVNFTRGIGISVGLFSCNKLLSVVQTRKNFNQRPSNNEQLKKNNKIPPRNF